MNERGFIISQEKKSIILATTDENDRHSIQFEMASSISPVRKMVSISFTVYCLLWLKRVWYISFKSTNFQIGSWWLLPIPFSLGNPEMRERKWEKWPKKRRWSVILKYNFFSSLNVFVCSEKNNIFFLVLLMKYIIYNISFLYSSRWKTESSCWLIWNWINANVSRNAKTTNVCESRMRKKNYTSQKKGIQFWNCSSMFFSSFFLACWWWHAHFTGKSITATTLVHFC